MFGPSKSSKPSFNRNTKLILQIFTTKRAEIESGKCRPRESKMRKRGQSLSAMVAALREPLEDSDDDNEDNMEAEGDGPLWQLFDQLHNTANASGKLTYFQLKTCVPSFILIFFIFQN